MRIFTVLLFVACSVVSIPFSQTASALSCEEPRPIEDEFRSSSIVFMGTALNPNTEKVHFRVNKMWKGSTDSIREGLFVGNMWMEIQAGQDYLMYVNNRDGRLEANICGNSKLWSEVNAEQFNEMFGTGQIIEQQGNGIVLLQQAGNGKLFLTLSGVLIIVIGTIITLWYRYSSNRKMR